MTHIAIYDLFFCLYVHDALISFCAKFNCTRTVVYVNIVHVFFEPSFCRLKSFCQDFFLYNKSGVHGDIHVPFIDMFLLQYELRSPSK